MTLWDDILLNDPFFRQALNDPLFKMMPDRPLLEGSSMEMTMPAPQQRLGSYFRFPRLDMTETDQAYIIKADLPGMKKENVSIQMQDDMLMIEGERKSEREEMRQNVHLMERSFGKFSRSLRLPVDANMEQVQATMDHGVLELKVSKLASQPGRKKISIN
jgi:HSP20 family molecular chaperone IbpA